MSNFTRKAINPSTGTVENAAMLDNFFGPHEYAVMFESGDVYRVDEVEFPEETEE